jgi:hypothetical protein
MTCIEEIPHILGFETNNVPQFDEGQPKTHPVFNSPYSDTAISRNVAFAPQSIVQQFFSIRIFHAKKERFPADGFVM